MSTLPPSRSTPYRAPVMSSQHNTAVTASLRSLAYHGVLPMADSLFGPEIRMVKHDGEIQDLPSCITDSENTRKLHGNDRTTARIFRCRLDSAAVERPHPDPPDFLSAAAVCYNTAAVPAVNPAGRTLCRTTQSRIHHAAGSPALHSHLSSGSRRCPDHTWSFLLTFHRSFPLRHSFPD